MTQLIWYSARALGFFVATCGSGDIIICWFSAGQEANVLKQDFNADFHMNLSDTGVTQCL